MSQDERNNALLEAAKKGYAATCRDLADAGADVNYKKVRAIGGMEAM
jgi:hypothetical protein